MSVFHAVLFWAVATAAGVIGLPFAELTFGRLPGRGQVFARPLGLLVLVYPAWLLASLHLVAFGRALTVVSLVTASAAAALLWRRHGAGRSDRAYSSIWLVGEALFALAFVGWLVLRSFSPDVWQTEKPMDMALIDVVNRSGFFPPHDPWLAGAHVNYYYLGHYLVAFLIRLSGVAPAVGFNLGVALFFALTAASVFGLAATLHAVRARQRGASERSSIAAGSAALVLAMVVGNLAGATQLIHHMSRLGTYDWWSPSRVIPGTANEFPFFSFLLGDLHAHVMATPFALVSVAYALQLATSGPAIGGRARRAIVTELVLASLVLGSLYAINGLDFPTAALVVLGASALRSLDGRRRGRPALVWAAALVVGGIVLFLPFWLRFSPPTHGVALVREHEQFTRFASHYLLILGIPLWALPVVFADRWRLQARQLFWIGSLALFALVLLAPPRLAGLALALSLAATATFATFATGNGKLTTPHRFQWLLLATALTLVAVTELLYIRDVFDGSPSFRFNTVFKAGYQAWFLLAVVAGVEVVWASERLRPRSYRAWLAGLAVLVAGGLVYPILASYSRTGGFGATPTLDGMRWLQRKSPGDAAAIGWLRDSVPGSPTVLESVGRDYDPDGRARVSTFTGLPSMVEWPGHELQWGHKTGSRVRDALRIYRTTDRQLAGRLLQRYGVSYVFVGSLERRDFTAAQLAKFARLGTVAYRSGSTVIYRIDKTAA